MLQDLKSLWLCQYQDSRKHGCPIPHFGLLRVPGRHRSALSHPCMVILEWRRCACAAERVLVPGQILETQAEPVRAIPVAVQASSDPPGKIPTLRCIWKWWKPALIKHALHPLRFCCDTFDATSHEAFPRLCHCPATSGTPPVYAVETVARWTYTLLQGDLQDPAYFDFISFAQVSARQANQI